MDSLPVPASYGSFHLISQDRTVLSGAQAIPDLVALLPLGGITSFLIRAAPGGDRVVGLFYSTLSRLHNTNSCGSKERPTGRSSGGETAQAPRELPML